MIVDQDYRHGLSGEELVGTLQSLLAAERTTMRLTCRYLADLADTMDNMEGGAGGALLGYADVYHAAECLFGLGVHGTRERIRVGRALRSLPRIEEAIVSGELSYSRARELTRVATPGDESAWLDLARTLPMRTLERRVVEATGKESPARTEGPAQLRWSTPETVEVTLRLPAEVWALLQRAMEGARRASEASLSHAEALAAVARDALERQNTDADTADPRHTVVLYECQSCARTEVDTGAGPLELGAGAAATLGCGARVRDLRTEGRVVRRGGPLPKAIERAVRLRDRNTCRVPGCRRRRYVDVHHITFQSEGGEHSRSNCDRTFMMHLKSAWLNSASWTGTPRKARSVARGLAAWGVSYHGRMLRFALEQVGRATGGGVGGIAVGPAAWGSGGGAEKQAFCGGSCAGREASRSGRRRRGSPRASSCQQ